jgi:NAD(P)-dependent dehydrogenase (short-subunit alcohol dehydrogenase family)
VTGAAPEGGGGRAFPRGGLAIVVGSTGGIGAALVARLRADPAFARVIGFARATDPPLDLADESTIERAARTIDDAGLDLRLVLVATGYLHGAPGRPEKSWRDLDGRHLAHAFAVNALGPALVMKHLLPRLAPAGKAVFAVLSAKVGSIGDNRLGGWYGYRASKAALNQFVRTAAVELKRSRPEAACVALHPGTVDTTLSRPFGKSGLDVRSPDDAAARLLDVVRRIGPEASGGFLDYRGDPLPW